MIRPKTKKAMLAREKSRAGEFSLGGVGHQKFNVSIELSSNRTIAASLRARAKEREALGFALASFLATSGSR